MTDLGRMRAGGRRRSTGPGWGLRTTPGPQDVQIVLAVISEYEDENATCSSYVLDWETGLDPATVDEVIDYLWTADMVECRVSSSLSRPPAAARGFRRATGDGGQGATVGSLGPVPPDQGVPEAPGRLTTLPTVRTVRIPAPPHAGRGDRH